MFQPGEKAIALWDTVEVLSTEGHLVTVKTEDGHIYTFPEHTLTRPKVVKSPVRRPRFQAQQQELDFELGMKLQSLIRTLPLDWRGHHLKGSQWTDKVWHEPEGKRKRHLFKNVGFAYDDNVIPSNEVVQTLLRAAESNQALDHWHPVVTGDKQYTCSHCSVGTVFETNGLAIRPTQPCPYPDGLVTEWTLNVPSGKVIIDDDLRYLCRIAAEQNINTRWGTHLAILDYAANGLTVGFGIGNSCPSVARHKGNKFTIGHRQGGKRVASVCTDLWAYSIIDYEEAEHRALYYGLDLGKETKHWSVNIVKIPPGLYQFRHFHNVPRDASNKVLFATFERIGNAVERDDWCARDRAFTAHITQVVQVMVQAWPTLYGEGRDWAQQCAAVFHSLFAGCVPDRDWHRNGHRNDVLPSDLEGVLIKEIPHFRFQGYWDIGRTVIETAVTRTDALFGGDIPFNESYALAAGRILESTISFGLPTRHITDEKSPRYDEYTVPEVRAEMHKAAALWYGLIQRYPHVAEDMQEFASWMEDHEAVGRWVDAFDLGPLKFDREAAIRERAESEAREKRARDVTLMQRSSTQVVHLSTRALGVTVVDPDCPEGQVGVIWEDGIRLCPLDLLALGPEAVAKQEADSASWLARFKTLLLDDD